MANYTKPVIFIQGQTIAGAKFMGDASAYEALKAGKTAHVLFGTPSGSEMPKMKDLVPFHAVANYIKFVYPTSAEKADPYGCDDSANKVRFVNDGGPCGDGSVVAEFDVPFTLTEENFPRPSTMSCGKYQFRGWSAGEEPAINESSLPLTITEPKTYSSFFVPIN